MIIVIIIIQNTKHSRIDDIDTCIIIGVVDVLVLTNSIHLSMENPDLLLVSIPPVVALTEDIHVLCHH